MTATIHEPARQIDVIRQTDVLVVGSGPGGLAAALASVRAGVETTLLERYGCFGGNITQVGVEGFAWYRHPATIDSEGIGREFEERAKAMGAAMPEPQSISHSLDAEGFKVVADTLVEEAGVIPMLHRLCVAPIMEGDTIRGVIVESKAGREAILAKRIIDATGDADIAHRAGAPSHKHPVDEMMSVSVMFSMSGVNKARFIMDITAPRFANETNARLHLEALRWSDGPYCPHCGSFAAKRLEGKSHRAGLVQCNDCREQYTVTVGTVFERSKVPLHKWLLCNHLLCASKKGMSAKQIERMLGVTYKTAWFMCHRLREAMDGANGDGPLGGPDKVVEADETYVGGKAKNRAFREPAPKKPVVALVERDG